MAHLGDFLQGQVVDVGALVFRGFLHHDAFHFDFRSAGKTAVQGRTGAASQVFRQGVPAFRESQHDLDPAFAETDVGDHPEIHEVAVTLPGVPHLAQKIPYLFFSHSLRY